MNILASQIDPVVSTSIGYGHVKPKHADVGMPGLHSAYVIWEACIPSLGASSNIFVVLFFYLFAILLNVCLFLLQCVCISIINVVYVYIAIMVFVYFVSASLVFVDLVLGFKRESIGSCYQQHEQCKQYKAHLIFYSHIIICEPFEKT